MTGFQFLSSRHLLSAKGIESRSNGELTARTIRKARQGMPAALARVDAWVTDRLNRGLKLPDNPPVAKVKAVVAAAAA